MSQPVILGNRDLALLGLLEMAPVTAVQIQKASGTFPEEGFRDERRARERLQTLAEAGLVRAFPAAVSGGGLTQYYRLSPAGYHALHPDDAQQPARTLFSEISPSRFQHAMAAAALVVHMIVTCQVANVRIAKYHGDGKITLAAGEYRQQPDAHFQLEHGGRTFNTLFEVDNATEPIDSPREQSIRTKLLGYETYQNWVLAGWKRQPTGDPPPRFRVVFLTKSDTRAKHILWLAGQLAEHKERRLVLAGTQDAFLAEPRAVTSPILLDHHGEWRSLVDLHPSSQFLREPVRITPPVAHAPFV